MNGGLDPVAAAGGRGLPRSWTAIAALGLADGRPGVTRGRRRRRSSGASGA